MVWILRIREAAGVPPHLNHFARKPARRAIPYKGDTLRMPQCGKLLRCQPVSKLRAPKDSAVFEWSGIMNMRVMCLAGAAVLALIGPANAGEGWYLGLGAGWDSAYSTRVTGAGLDGKLRSRDTALIEASGGYNFGSFRLEAETSWDRHVLDTYSSGGFNDSLDDAHLEMRSVLVNGIYDIPITSRFKISVGAGAGVGNDRVKFYDPALATTFSNGDRTRFMWQGIGGLTYTVNPNLDLFVDYRYRSDIGGNNASVLASTMRTHNVNEQAVIAGFRWYPGAHEERVAYQSPPPPAPMAPPPPPAPPPAVRTFIVFFDFNKSNLTPEAVNVVGEAVKEAKTNGSVRVLVTGHTDTVGSDAYNQALSVRRAQSVKDQMVSDGLENNSIAIEGKSFHDPLVATGPGVREPQNRRAVIDLNG
jgi:outer membrane protein OmpA-like peptidoglycan-associated protein